MKKFEYKVIVGANGFESFEKEVSEKLADGWKPIGGVAFNCSYPHQAMAKVAEADSKEGAQIINKSLTANEAMKRLNEIT